MKQYDGFIPFDEIAKMKRSLSKPKRVTKVARTKRKGKPRSKKAKEVKTCECGKSHVIVEKKSEVSRCSKCTDPGIIIRGQDDSLYILKKTRSIKKWVKI